jgi:hypothetical protein
LAEQESRHNDKRENSRAASAFLLHSILTGYDCRSILLTLPGRKTGFGENVRNPDGFDDQSRPFISKSLILNWLKTKRKGVKLSDGFDDQSRPFISKSLIINWLETKRKGVKLSDGFDDRSRPFISKSLIIN